MIRILIVDDEPSLLLTLEANLSEVDGIVVTTADNGAKALELVGQQPFDLVMSDVKMPGMNGVELFREIRKVQPELPFVLMTAFAMETLIDEAKREGTFAVLPKPFDIEQVLPILLRAASRPMVLIVDQDADAAAASLQEIGLRASAALGEEAIIEVVRGGAADVCVIEVGAAAQGEVPLIDRLRQVDPQLSFIALSGHDLPEMVRKIATSGAVNIMKKPVAPDKLAQSIADARGRRAERK